VESIVIQDPEYVLVLSGDHIYKMNYHEMIEWHQQSNADITIATIQIRPEEAFRFGIAEITADYDVVGFEEKPRHGHPMRSVFNPEMVSASMGIYVFNTQTLLEALTHDAEDSASTHDFGRDVIRRLLPLQRVVAYDFRDLNDKTARYWRDVGTLDAYYEANLDLVAVTPEFNLYDRRWPVHTRRVQQPPTKFVFSEEGRRMGFATDSIVSPGVIVSGGRVTGSVLSPGVRVHSYSEVESSILLPSCDIGRYSRIRRAIIGANVVVPESSIIGFDVEQDRAAGYQITETGVVVVA
jgi:glucose-1-phosphate adenylyltransferase